VKRVVVIVHHAGDEDTAVEATVTVVNGDGIRTLPAVIEDEPGADYRP
jgi:hypothetical protein